MKTVAWQTIRTLLVVLTIFSMGSAQQPAPPPQPANSGAASHYDRMAAAKTVFLKNAGGNDIPFNVISRNFESWARYLVVDSPDNADMIVEIRSPDDGTEKKDNKDSNKTNVYGGNQQKQQSSAPAPAIDVIILTVYDKNMKPMWIGREEPKFAIRHKVEEGHLIEAAQKLFMRFHDRIEPPAKP